MIDFYNAFISYKHAKLDTAIAEHVQKNLEHFHVPHRLRKGLKHEKITRIFRDKDELPITSDLTETITDALEKAEYLIVICSTNTKESIWVKREINTFLKTHSQDKVLTVLCDGEPDQVIPEELLSMNKQFVDANGIMQTVRVPVEPLSCDYRLPKRRADREELPRLASAILGCSYDELQRRRRQYMIRRAAAVVAVVFAGLIALSTYMSYSRQQIDNSLIESLRSRSKYLANESSQLLEDDKRTDAVQLALAALPGGDKDKMPVTPEAIRAITDATAAYRSNAGMQFEPIWNFKAERAITKFIISDDGGYIATIDKSGNIDCWNTDSHKHLMSKTRDGDPMDILFLGKDSIMIVYHTYVETYNVESGKLVWTYETGELGLQEGDVEYTNNEVFVPIEKGALAVLAAKDGKVRDTIQLKGTVLTKSVYDLTVSPDGRKIGYSDSSIVYGDDSLIHIYDRDTGKDNTTHLDSYYIHEMYFVDNDHLCIMANDSIFGNSASFSTDFSYIAEGTETIYCFDKTMKQLWKNEMLFSDVIVGLGVKNLPSRNAVVAYAGNAAAIYDITSGNELNYYRVGSPVVNINDSNKDGLPEFICNHGEFLFARDTDSNSFASYSVLGNDIKFGYITDRIFIVRYNTNDIICYDEFLQDDEWEAVSGYGSSDAGSSYQVYCYDEDYLIIAASTNDVAQIKVSFIDIKKAKLLSVVEIENPGQLTNRFHFECVDGEYYGVFGEKIFHVDPKKCTVKDIGVTLEYETEVVGGKLVDCNVEDEELIVNVSDLDGKHAKELTLDDVEDIHRYDSFRVRYVEQLDTLFISVNDRVFIGDLKSERLTELEVPKGWDGSFSTTFYATSSDDGSQILITDGHYVVVMNASYKEQYTLQCNSSHRFGAVFKNGLLYVAEDYYFVVYKGNNGELISKKEMELWGVGDATMAFDERSMQVMVQTGDQICIIDMNTWTEIANIQGAYCYEPTNDRFFVYSYIYSGSTLPGYIRHYTVGELIDKAERYLDGQELDDVTKSKYGL